MLIKNFNKNKYILENKIYVRDLTNENSVGLDLNHLFSDSDLNLIIENEMENFSQRIPEFELENYDNIIILGSGYNSKEDHIFLKDLNKKTCIIGINNSLKNWNFKELSKRNMNYYFINNPYDDSLNYLPTSHNYYPKCIASIRTNPNFIKNYKGNKFFYCPTPNINYSNISKKYFNNTIDDYRNSVCGSLSLAFKFNAKKIILCYCDDSFVDNRPGSVLLENNLYCYPQQLFVDSIINNMCHWFKTKKIEIFNYSSNKLINNSIKINNTNEILELFNE